MANGNAFARGPVLFTTQAGTVLAFAGYQSSPQDNTGSNDIFVRRSNDNGKTFGAASIISPPQLPGDAALLASWGGTSWIVGSPDLVQRQDGTIYMFYDQTRNGGPQAVAQQQYVYRYMTSKDDGQTWSTRRHHGGNGLRWESECGHDHVGHGSDAGSRAPWIDF